MSGELIAEQHPLTSGAVVARVRLIQQVMKDVMKENTHYGIIPGCEKPSLWKPGAEQLLVTFRIAPDEPKVDDLSSGDCVRYRVTRTGRSGGSLVASGVGECSSDEEKYRWRKPVCEKEYDSMPEDRRRLKYRKDGSTYQQVRTNPADVANTILKMADKRAFVAMTLLATAASDIFTQDLEDLPPEVAESIEGAEAQKPPIKHPTPKKKSADCGSFQMVPSEISEKSGTGKNGPWTRTGLKGPDGKWYGTFDADHASELNSAKNGGYEVHVEWIKDGDYLNMTNVTAVAEAESRDAQEA